MPVAQRRIIRDRNAKPCAVVRRAVQRVNIAWSSALTTSFAFGRPVINTPIHASMPEPHATSNLRDRTLVDSQLSLINGPVPDHQIAPCWMVITNNGRFAYASNADSQAISGFQVHPDGTISLLDPNGSTATTPSDTFPLEEGLSANSQFLYVLDSRLLLSTPGPATLSGFGVQADG